MNSNFSESNVSLFFSYTYTPVPWPVCPPFQFGYNTSLLADTAQSTDAEERA
jgi:hypothetical protein